MTAAELLLFFCADGDARVRATALNCLCNWAQYEKHKHNGTTNKRKYEWISDHWQQVYTLACKLITEDNSKVRQVSLRAIYLLGLRFGQHETPADTINLSGGSIENASLDMRLSPKKLNPYRPKLPSLVDDAFSRVCDRLQDPSRYVRQTAAGLIGDLAKFVSEESLLLTLEKTVMSDRQVKRFDRLNGGGGVDKSSLWGPVVGGSSGRPMHRAHQHPQAAAQSAPISVDSISLLSTGALGALINGLEDEFHEVRCATLSTVTQIAAYNARFASLCQDILVDMLTDDIQSVRLRAVNALQTVGDQVPILNDQVAIVTSALAEDSVVIRQRIHALLSRCRLVSPPCLLSLLDGLLANLRLYPEDRNSVCAAAVGRRHPFFVEVCVTSLLRTHPWLSDQEPFREDPAYITVLLLVLNAHPHAPGMAAHFPRHLATSQAYLRELVPHLLPKETMRFSFVWKPSTDLCLPYKRQRLDRGLSDDVDDTTGSQLFRFLTSTVGLLRRLLADCVHTLHQRRELPTSPDKSAGEPMDTDEKPAVSASELKRRLARLGQASRQELRVCQNSLGAPWLGDLPSWLNCLVTAAQCLLAATLHQTTNPKLFITLLRQVKKLSLRAEHLYLGLTPQEVAAVRGLRSALSSPGMLDASTVSRVLTELLDVCLRTEDIESCVGRIQKPHAQLLHPPPTKSDVDSTGAGQTPAGPLPEIRFTAVLATAAVRVRAIVTGLSLQQASLMYAKEGLSMLTDSVQMVLVFRESRTRTQLRSRVRVLYRRPDTAGKAQRQCSWLPPASAWEVLDGPLMEPGGGELAHTTPHTKAPRLELQTTLELTASCWSDTATLEIGLGISVPTTEGNPDDDELAPAVISLLPPDVVAKVKLLPCDTSHRW
ncbi:unnamed protein product [Mesocestoides corti]|uniref:Integrator complex subunit 4 n=1 Tax=Mesocestoides corti TaxID=53468 RepID=A0A158QSV3_MESCO|nr:unnamed protein product [Mesocestoides corti]